MQKPPNQWWLIGWEGLTVAACRIWRAQTIKPCFAAITAGALHLLFAATGVKAVLTLTPIHCPISAAGTACGGTTQQTISWLKSLWGHAAHLHLRMHASGRSIRLRGFGWYPGAQRSQFGPVVWCMQLSHTPPLRRPFDSNSAQSKWQLCAWLLHSHPEGDRGVQGHVKNRKLQLRPLCRLSTVRKLISAQHCFTFLPNMRSHMKSGVCLL